LIELKLTRRTLVICEKPTAARRIAQALDDAGEPEGYRERGAPYFIASRGGAQLVVVSALGHLFTVAQRGDGWTYPVFDLKWVPAYETDKSAARTRGFIKVIEKLSKDVDGYVSACDYDMEGSLIAYTILRHICGEESLKKAGRMRPHLRGGEPQEGREDALLHADGPRPDQGMGDDAAHP